MIKRVHGGLVVSTDDFTLQHPEDGSPSGIYINISRFRAFLYHAGLPDSAKYELEIPTDPEWLREFSRAISLAADDIEASRNPRETS